MRISALTRRDARAYNAHSVYWPVIRRGARAHATLLPYALTFLAFILIYKEFQLSTTKVDYLINPSLVLDRSKELFTGILRPQILPLGLFIDCL